MFFLRGDTLKCLTALLSSRIQKHFQKLIWIIIDLLPKKRWVSVVFIFIVLAFCTLISNILNYIWIAFLSNISCFGPYISVDCTEFQISKPTAFTFYWCSYVFQECL